MNIVSLKGDITAFNFRFLRGTEHELFGNYQIFVIGFLILLIVLDELRFSPLSFSFQSRSNEVEKLSIRITEEKLTGLSEKAFKNCAGRAQQKGELSDLC